MTSSRILASVARGTRVVHQCSRSVASWLHYKTEDLKFLAIAAVDHEQAKRVEKAAALADEAQWAAVQAALAADDADLALESAMTESIYNRMAARATIGDI
jgi:hypothetical protein